ncbi:putative transaldolase [Alphaproteobacteria bacterium]
MQIFVRGDFTHSDDPKIIKELHDVGFVDGVVVDVRTGGDVLKLESFIKNVCDVISTRIHIPILASGYEDILDKAKVLLGFNKDLVVLSLPLSINGLKACKKLSDAEIPVNVTSCFSGAHAFLAAKAGAKYVSLPINNLDNSGFFGIDLISDVCGIYENYPEIEAQVIVNVDSPVQLIEAAKLGCDVVSVTPQFLFKLAENACCCVKDF